MGQKRLKSSPGLRIIVENRKLENFISHEIIKGQEGTTESIVVVERISDLEPFRNEGLRLAVPDLVIAENEEFFNGSTSSSFK